MNSAIRRSVLLSLPALALTLGGCGIYEQTQGWYPRYNGAPAEAGDIGLRNVLVVASTDGQATVLSSFANRGEADQLVEVRIGDASATPADGPLEIPARGYASLGPETEQVDLQDVELTPGLTTEVEFHFANAPRVTVETLVKKADGPYAAVTFPETQELPTDDAADLGGDDDGGEPGSDDAEDPDAEDAEDENADS
ncbi:hypothetical protein G1H11_05780 [Phytoactinopolyspora alkaliphila]|uniref:Copper chaperone PCu(A)C n=1 Tax=Phytoactinopolyspora alkaliphila TaxID=1783498 RepID=A0A6N9YIN6_9ACTN|nr:hypothetical protein [Phytoactinopolyspora alkaliphila]NED94817.1 hypothetical protein [Phytoactinopolyspora alkaliphila]